MSVAYSFCVVRILARRVMMAAGNGRKGRRGSEKKKSTTSKSQTTGKSSKKVEPTARRRNSEKTCEGSIRLDDLTETQKREIRDKLYDLLSHTKQDSTICPSQVPRALNKADRGSYPDWRALMDSVRELVWQEVKKGRVEVTQKGEVRTYDQRDSLKGPIRVRRGPEWKDPKDER